MVGDEGGGLADGPAPGAIPVKRPKAGRAHQTSDPMLAAGFTCFAEVEEGARRAVDALAGRVGCPNQAQQTCVFESAVRDRLLEPRVLEVIS